MRNSSNTTAIPLCSKGGYTNTAAAGFSYAYLILRIFYHCTFSFQIQSSRRTPFKKNRPHPYNICLTTELHCVYYHLVFLPTAIYQNKFYHCTFYILSLHNLHFITAHFIFITAQIGYHCTLKLGMQLCVAEALSS